MTSSEPRQRPLWIESPETGVGPVARVAMLAPLDKPYTYAVPAELADAVVPGKRVIVPFGRKGRPLPGFCLSVAQEPWTSTLKPILEVVDEQALLSESLIALGQWIARYYVCPLGRTLSAMVPEAIRVQAGFRTVKIYRLPCPDGTADAQSPDDAGTVASPQRRSAKREGVIKALADLPTGLPADDLIARTGVTSALLAAMHKAGELCLDTRREPAPAPDFDHPGPEPAFQLNDTQRKAVDKINALADRGLFRVLLLFGVSGSGKTEVYIHAIRHVLAAGRQAILLIPEIALTTQIVDRLASRFTDVAVIHSGLTGVQRSLTWSAIARGEKRIVIGTRSAVFAPCPNLGLIVLDEEQEGSYKNQQSPRFHTREVAIKRAQLANIPVVLGSATPALETWSNTEQLRHFERIDLPARIAGLPMPKVELVDMRLAQRQRRGIHLLSPALEEALAQTLAAGQQAVLLLNRRGYANYLLCPRCREAITCPHCRVNMVFHQTTGQAKCHYCGTSTAVPQLCPTPGCAGVLVRFGMGTQRVEEELHSKFPQARLARADSDTMLHTADYAAMLSDFAERRTDVLIGTQMIAKGLDFPAVALVGVVNADTSLAVPDFRAAERTFQLITQVAGRAGRAQAGGRVVVQTFLGRSPALEHAMRHDYVAFARHELGLRRQMSWPPFARLARVVVTHRNDQEAGLEAVRMADALRKHLAEHKLPGEVLGPQSAPLGRLKGLYRHDLLIRTANANQLLEVMERLRHARLLGQGSRNVLIDVDPATLL